ncbi:MAG: transketolase [Ruminococcus sp.]|jgi:transketolase|nr:transketolase [Ruminococcus sp.]
MEVTALKKKTFEIRRQALKMVYQAQTGHIGGTLSSIDYLTVLYYEKMRFDHNNPDWPGRDRFILSKGHSVEGYLSILADLGFFPKEELATFCQFKTRLIGHPDRRVPGVEMNTGSLGHGLSAACGMALASKRDNAPCRIYTLLGDGELGEGSVWEAAMFAGNYQLDNLYAAVDRNHLQISGKTEEVMQLEPLRQKFESFGFATEVIDGNNIAEILAVLEKLEHISGKPKMILLDTIKGKGVSFMENKAYWHHGLIDQDQYEQALADLAEREGTL